MTTDPTKPATTEVMALSAPAEVPTELYDEDGWTIEKVVDAPEHWDSRVWHRRGDSY